MTHEIGEAAGRGWRHLEQNGKTSSLTVLARETGLKKQVLDRAIGWLAREDKVEIHKCGRQEEVSLREV